jgi:hypothetical protein
MKRKANLSGRSGRDLKVDNHANHSAHFSAIAQNSITKFLELHTMKRNLYMHAEWRTTIRKLFIGLLLLFLVIFWQLEHTLEDVKMDFFIDKIAPKKRCIRKIGFNNDGKICLSLIRFNIPIRTSKRQKKRLQSILLHVILMYT